MILVDANLLLYAYDKSAERHKEARRWLEEHLSGEDVVALSWHSITAFLRISTNPRAYLVPLAIGEAIGIVTEWLHCETVTILIPGKRHWAIFKELLEEGQAAGPLVMDAHVAALAIEHGATLCTTDRDFSRFQGLRAWNPLLGS